MENGPSTRAAASILGETAGMIPATGGLEGGGKKGDRMDAKRTERERSLLALARSGAAARERRRRAAAARGTFLGPAVSGSPVPDGDRAERDLDCLRSLGARVVGCGDPEMPPRLGAIPDAPAVLLVRGDPRVLSAPQVAVVGSRRATPAGARIARRLAGELAARGLVVTSGLAQGVDAEAHRGALEAGGRTVAVLGSSLDRIYPSAHRSLAERIAGQGALVSEFPFGTRPVPWNFPWRNRIISGLSLGVVVVEATARSGSLITARWALEQGREVFAVPGPAGPSRSRGPHRLIRQGAKLVENVADIIEEIAPQLAAAPSPPSGPSPEIAMPPDGTSAGRSLLGGAAGEILRDLEAGPLQVDDVIERTGLSPQQVSQMLLELELQGLLRQLPGKRYALGSTGTGNR